ncbi:hypothetical protein HYX12_00260 [Candidatus Woesearchaeota archaeon]|nr:hypothetical protein [Candidatus Woesearchaeota archaeon]
MTKERKPVEAISIEGKSFRKISKGKYIIAGILTFLIFSLGLALGMVLEDYRYNLVEEINGEQEANYLSLQLQYLYLNSFSEYDNCPILSATLKKAVVDLDNTLSQVVAYEEEKDISSKRKEIIQRRYVLDNLRYWLLAKESKQKCDLDIVPIIYFYTEDCPSCPNQGTILSYFKNVFGERVLVFPINLKLNEQEPMVEVVSSLFEVDSYPSLVIDHKKFEGVVKKEQLQKIICDSLENAPECSGSA